MTIKTDRELGMTYEKLAKKYHCSKRKISETLKGTGTVKGTGTKNLFLPDIKQIASKDIFGLRFYSWLARSLGVKGYSNMNLKQLKVKIGKYLINN